MYIYIYIYIYKYSNEILGQSFRNIVGFIVSVILFKNIYSSNVLM